MVRIGASPGVEAMAKLFASPLSVLDDASRALALESVELAKDSFAHTSSPDGGGWAPLVCRSGRPLLATGALMNSIALAHASVNGFAIIANRDWSATHQYGANIRAKNADYLMFQCGGRWVKKKEVTIPARPFFPKRGIPAAWEPNLDKAATDAMDKHYNG